MRAPVGCLTLGLMLAGCAHRPPPAAERPPITVAVVEFGVVGQEEAENGCVQAVLEAGYRAVDRKSVEAALSVEDVTIEQPQKLGQMLSADLIIDGGIVTHGKHRHKTPTPKIISTRTGDLLAISKVRGHLARNFKLGQKVCTDLLRQLP